MIIVGALGKAENHLKVYMWLQDSNNFTRLSMIHTILIIASTIMSLKSIFGQKYLICKRDTFL